MGMPGERRLDRPPSERYLIEPEAPTPLTGSTMRALGAGLAAALGWSLATILFGGVLAVSLGLLVLAAAFGRLIALAVAWGGGSGLAAGPRLAIALATVVDGFLVGQFGVWAYGRLEGGVLAPVEYVMTTFGIVVPLQLLVALGVAWWTAR